MSHAYIPHYIETIDSAVTNMSPEMSILYLVSDYPNVLDLVLERSTGSGPLRRFLDITRYSSMAQAQRCHAARPLTAVYKDHGSYGVLGDEEYYRKQRGIAEGKKEPVYLKTDCYGKSQTIYFNGPGQDNFRFRVTLVDGNPQKKDPEHTIDLNTLPVYQYFVGRHALHFQIDQNDGAYDTSLSCDVCRFFYLTNADALDMGVLARMLQAFLEYRELYPNAKLVLTGMSRCIPAPLTDRIALIRLGSPSLEDIRYKLRERLGDKDHRFSQEKIEQFTQTLKGLTYLQLENVFAFIGPNLAEELVYDEDSLEKAVWRQRKKESEKEKTLIYQKIEHNPGVVGIGGFSRWLNENLPDLVDPQTARAFGITPPRGVILAGIPGTGKSQLAKQLAYQWEHYHSSNHKSVCFIEFKIGNLSSSKYGESESKMERFLARISEQDQAVLFIDEVEKIFYRDKPGQQGMHEVKRQQMGMLLSWLQEHKENIFTFMTSNDIDALPPELIRAGRLSERFFVFLPNYLELMSMLYVFLKEKAENQIFSDSFNEEIKRICGVIETHSTEYGCDSENDPVLDQRLSDAIQGGSLQGVLINLTRYAINPDEYKDDKRYRQEKYQWDALLTDDAIHMRTPFMTGADMNELVKNTILYLRRKLPRKNWTGEEFAKAMEDCCCRSEFTPYGQSNLDKLVELYLGCDYRGASAHPLVPRFCFNANLGVFSRDQNGEYIEGTNPDNLYDQYLQQVLMREIEKEAGRKNRAKEREERQDRLQKIQELNLGFQKQQMERQKMQWKEEDQDKEARKKYEENVREYQRIQLEKAKAEK